MQTETISICKQCGKEYGRGHECKTLDVMNFCFCADTKEERIAIQDQRIKEAEERALAIRCALRIRKDFPELDLS